MKHITFAQMPCKFRWGEKSNFIANERLIRKSTVKINLLEFEIKMIRSTRYHRVKILKYQLFIR